MKEDRDAEREFLDAMRGVRPVEKDRRRAFRRRPAGRGEASPAVRFRLERQASRIYGLREGVPEARLEELRSGDLAPANSLDLHGMTEEAARARVSRFLRQSSVSGLACVALVHGRGLRSPAGPVLKEALPGWLTELPAARLVLAFGSAPVDRGGDGVTLVRLGRHP